MGKLILGDGFVDAYAKRTGLPAYTSHTLAKVEDLLEVVHHARDDGYALDNREAGEVVGCNGVPSTTAAARS